MYFKPETGETFADHSVIRSRLNVLFTEIIADEELAHYGVFPVVSTESGANDLQVAVPGMPELVDGVWTQTWALRDATPEELASRVPQTVTRRQARQALLLAGLLDSVEPAIAAIPDAMQRRLAQIEWEDSQTFERQRSLVIQIGTALGLDSAGLDALFIHAGSL